ncbi:MAG TPA: hypothetical protein VK755_02740, partial [Candidatus Acidoferrales bacterium]|nr:hypothetical protein [Candidatus Acidoferrales bacterium]
GAGGIATRSAVLGDVVSILRGLRQRHGLAARARRSALAPAIDAEPFFARLPSVAELPHFKVWDDAATNVEAPALANA